MHSVWDKWSSYYSNILALNYDARTNYCGYLAWRKQGSAQVSNEAGHHWLGFIHAYPCKWPCRLNNYLRIWKLQIRKFMTDEVLWSSLHMPPWMLDLLDLRLDLFCCYNQRHNCSGVYLGCFFQMVWSMVHVLISWFLGEKRSNCNKKRRSNWHFRIQVWPS